MSPFLVYLLFQAGSIGAMFAAFAFILGVIGLAFLIASFESICSWDDKEVLAQSKIDRARYARRLIPAAIVLAIVAFLVPSPKTIAAMIVLPKITTPQAIDTMSKESRDIYGLAKKALANLADDKPAKADKK
jgi:hypothetical protein